MSKTVYFECLSGISGDMTIGALLDLGADFDVFKKELEKLNLEGYHIEINKKSKNGIFGTKFDVILKSEGDTHDHDHEHHDHSHGHHDHSHEHHDHGHAHHSHEHHNHSHAHHTHSHDHDRNLVSITEMILSSTLSETVKTMSIDIFNEVAKAEAKIHNTSINEVHFHEVGAVDSIVDIVGTAILIEMLEIETVYTSPVHVGTGFVKCDHGKIPVPAPATLEILKGIPIYSKGIRSELVTPTGAAIIKVLTDEFIERPHMVTENIGYGIATKDLEIANLLRVSVLKKKDINSDLWMVECNIDDMNGELYSHLMKRLLDQGAKDVTYSSIYMKKNRPATQVSVLVDGEHLESIERLILIETTTFGIRKYPVTRTILDRSFEKRSTEFGEVVFKIGILDGKTLKVTPEYESLNRIAESRGIPLRTVYEMAQDYIMQNF